MDDIRRDTLRVTVESIFNFFFLVAVVVVTDDVVMIDKVLMFTRMFN